MSEKYRYQTLESTHYYCTLVNVRTRQQYIELKTVVPLTDLRFWYCVFNPSSGRIFDRK